MADPNTLTVERLRKELTDRNVPLPKYPKKEALVELYKQHIVSSRAPKSAASGHRLEFSDEDDETEVSKSRKSLGTMSKRRSLGTKGRDEVIITSSGMNISNMSDAELVDSLQQSGADVGPVTGTTRSVYEKKLLKLLEGGVQRDRAPRISPLKNRAAEQQRKPMTHYSDEDDEEEVEEEEEEDMDLKSGSYSFEQSYGQQSNRYNNEDYSEGLTARKKYTTSEEESYDPFSYRRSMDSAIRQPLSSFGQTGDLSRPQLSGFTSTTRRSQVYTSSEYSRPGHILRDGPSSLSSTGKGKAKRRGFCFWLLVLLLLIGLIVIVIVVWNMDPAFQNLVPALSKSEEVKGAV